MVQRTDFGSAARGPRLVGLRRWVSGPTVPAYRSPRSDTSWFDACGSEGEVLLSRKAETNAPSPYCSASASAAAKRSPPSPRDGRPPQGRPPCSALVRAPWTSMSNTATASWASRIESASRTSCVSSRGSELQRSATAYGNVCTWFSPLTSGGLHRHLNAAPGASPE